MPKLKDYLTESEKPSLKAFADLVAKHDITFSFANGKPYDEGQKSFDAIYKMFNELKKIDPKNDQKCVDIWNKNVKKKINIHSQQDFMWDA